MKFCPNCGAELKPEAKFCAACGTPIAFTPPPPVQPAPQQQTYYQQQEPAYQQARDATNAFQEAISGKTNLFQRVINILTKPKEEWLVITNEKPDKMKLLFGYVIILALIPALISFINFAFINSYFSISYAIVQSGISFVLTIAVVYLTSFVVDALAPSFYSEKNFDRSFQLVCYAYTPGWIAAILGIVPGLNIVASLVGFAYMIYLFITGVPVMKKTPTEKATAYTIISILILIVIYAILAALLAFVLLKIIFRGMMYTM
jgi:hypothetical protein